MTLKKDFKVLLQLSRYVLYTYHTRNSKFNYRWRFLDKPYIIACSSLNPSWILNIKSETHDTRGYCDRLETRIYIQKKERKVKPIIFCSYLVWMTPNTKTQYFSDSLIKFRYFGIIWYEYLCKFKVDLVFTLLLEWMVCSVYHFKYPIILYPVSIFLQWAQNKFW